MKQESPRSGVELVPRAVAAAHGTSGAQQAGQVLEQSFGAWNDDAVDGEAYVDQLRRGLGRRLAR